jgi:hypothetical protein
MSEEVVCSKEDSVFYLVCPTKGMEGNNDLGNSKPAGEICLYCGQPKGVGYGKCNFSIIPESKRKPLC